MDPYSILGVNKNASQDEIKKAFRKKAMEHHPDKGGNEEEFKQINEAYSKISDPEKRSQHDAMRDGRGMGFGFGGFDPSSFGDMFGDIFGSRSRKRKETRSTADNEILFDLRVNLEQVKQGIRQTAVFEKNVACKPCDGHGGENKNECLTCAGSGIVISQPNAYTFHQRTCTQCRGQGFTFSSVCGFCHGQGVKKIKDSVSFIVKQI
tara:strand:- start:390 stop:1010 length:621 start_codon:yes stop_codon:yes gene_type:complete